MNSTTFQYCRRVISQLFSSPFAGLCSVLFTTLMLGNSPVSAQSAFFDVLHSAPIRTVGGYPDAVDASSVTNLSLSQQRDKDLPLQLLQQQLAVTLTAMGRDFSLLLVDSAVNRSTRYINSDNNLIDTSSRDPLASHVRLLSGEVVGDDQSWVRLSLRDGVLTGYIKAFGELFKIEQTSVLRAAGVKLETNATTVMTISPGLSGWQQLLTRNREEHGVAGSQQKPGHSVRQEILVDWLMHPPARNTGFAADSAPQALPSSNPLTSRIDGVSVPRAMRIGIVVDSLFNEHHQNRGVEHALTLINAIDGIYQEQLGIAVILDTVRAITDPLSDPMRGRGGSIESILENFREVRQNDSTLPADLTLVHLFTGLRDPESVIGLGWINTACRVDGYDVSVSTPFAFDVLLAAHEMAHNLGALHDDDPSCQTDRSHIMWPRLSSNTAALFSQCSKDAIAPNIGLPCNLDNIDLSAGLLSATGRSPNTRNVTMLLRNNDPVRRADNVATLARLPIGSQIIDAPGFCFSSGQQLRCQFGDIAPATTLRANVLVSVNNAAAAQWVQFETITSSFADVDERNNTVVLDILSLGSTDTVSGNDAGFADDAAQSSAELAATGDSTTGGSSGDAIGAAGKLLLLALLMRLAVPLARRRREYQVR